MKRSPLRKQSPKKSLEKKADKLWSTYIRMRDKDTCRICKKPGRNPHHIFTRSIKHLRHNPDNGICLCAYCHVLGKYSAHKGPYHFKTVLEKEIGHGKIAWLEFSAGQTMKPDYNMAILNLEDLIKKYE